jgi:hypothetical protein
MPITKIDNTWKKSLAAKYTRLLNAPGTNELKLKAFFEKNPSLIPAPWMLNHGIHFGFVFPQFKVSTGLTTDFVYLTKSSATWWCVLIEFERPDVSIFKKNSHTAKFSAEFLAGIEQVRDWQLYLKEHRDGFLRYLRPFMRPVTMASNPLKFRYVLVIGRRKDVIASHSKTERFSLFENAEADSTLRVMTYDGLLSEFFESPWIGDRDLLVRKGEKFKFKLLKPRPSQSWSYLTNEAIDLTEKQISQLEKVGVQARGWAEGKGLTDLGRRLSNEK